MIRYLRQPPALQNLASKSNVTSTVLGTTFSITNARASTSRTTGAVIVAGGVGIAGNLNAGNISGTNLSGTITTAYQPNITQLGVQSTMTAVDLTVTGNLVIAGSVSSVAAQNSSVADALIELHTSGSALTLDDGRDIGIEFNYYKSSAGVQRSAYMVWDNATGRLKYVSNGTVSAGGVVSGTAGTLEAGALVLTNGTLSTSTTTGALVVAGGLGVSGAAYLANLYTDNIFRADGTPYGAMGATGAQGITGATGPQGATGAGATGFTGSTGSTGPQGATGFGVPGLAGATGQMGATGIQGLPGATGAQGIPGTAAAIGATGASGLAGIAGPAGQTGATGAPGVAGPVGQSGQAGIAGATGIAGAPGAAGEQGATGLQGPAGTNGAGGATGATGGAGPAGQAGATGLRGLRGLPGSDGAAGEQGATGISGTDGADGATGATGLAGPTGAQGPQGNQGATGISGIDGADGATGATGLAGQTGAQGPQGTRGATGIAGTDGDNGATGATGLAGPVGAQGVQGNQGATGIAGPVGPQGDRGSTGFAGPVGQVGPQGDRGSTGLAGPVGQTGATGSQGATGLTGPQGTQGNQGATGFQGTAGTPGAQGSTGATGIAGPVGPQGVTGATGTGATGASGAVGYTGSAGEQGIPGAAAAFGYTGSQGIQGTPGGATGATGPRGVTGATGLTGPEGSTGIRGLTGYTGSQGDIGYTGSQGIQGYTGYTGSMGATGVGYTGSQGIQGDTGYTGSIGATGVLGYTGSSGTNGATGVVGYTGSRGIAGATGATGVIPNVILHTIQISNVATSTSTTTGALVVSDGVGISGNLNVGGTESKFNGNVIVAGDLTVLGNTLTVNSTTVTYTDSILELNKTANSMPLTSDDGRDSGILVNYYRSASKQAFVGWDNSGSEFALASNVTVDNNVVTYNEYGNVRLGNLNATGDIRAFGNIIINGSISITGGITSSGGAAAIVGNVIPLGMSSDSDLVTPGATSIWTPTTTVTDAIDDLNEVMLNVAKGTFVGSVDFNASAVAGPSPLTMTFSRTFTGTGTSYLWDFGDGTTSTSSTPTKTYNNTSGGQFTVQLTVSNSSGSGTGASNTKTKTNYITLYTPTPIPSFTLNKTALDTGTSVSLTNTSQNAQSYVIYWGDGTSDVIASNSVAGGAGGGAKSHTYNVSGSADTRYQPYIEAVSSTAGTSAVTVASGIQNVYVYKTHSPTFTYTTLTGNNDYTLNPDGWNVTFTNTTAAGVGATATFSGNYYKWTWGDGTTTNVNAGSGAAGDRNVNITHKFSLTNPAVTQTFEVKLEVYNGYSTSPFATSTVTVTVNPDPQAIFSGVLVTASDRTGDSAQTGYYFTDLNGVNRAIARFTNSSLNTDSYKWTWGDGSDSGVLTTGPGTPGSTIDHIFTSAGSYTVSLLSTGTYSETLTDDTNTKTNYIVINSVPAAPAGLSAKTLSMSTASAGTSPYLAAQAADNSGGNIPTAGTSVTRYTSGTVTTNTVADAYNSYTGTLSAEFNGATDGSISFTSGNDAGTYGNLVVTSDRDANLVSPSTYPSNFYKVFSAYATKAVGSISTGYNQVKLIHSVTGSTNAVGYVKDDVTSVPTVDVSSATLTTGTAGTYLYVSGIPYFNTGSPTVVLAGAQIYNWIGQTYQNTTTPFTIAPDTNDESTTGSVIVSQTKTYSNLDGATTFLSGGVPKANTGKDTGNRYTIGSQTINVAPASTMAVQTIKYSATNVNGTSATATVAKKIQVFTSTPSGFVETSITAPSGATTAKRIAIAGATGANPTFSNSTNYYTSNAWSGAVTVAGTDEAVVRWNQLKWFNTDLSTGYLPVGPNLNSGRTGGNQYFRGAFTRGSLQNFNVTFTGKISGLFFAAPGTAISTASTLNGWINASLSYAGSGVPGAGAGGNGSNGCAITVADRVPTGSVVSGTTYRFTLGSENLANAFGNQMLFCIVLASGDYVTSWSFS